MTVSVDQTEQQGGVNSTDWSSSFQKAFEQWEQECAKYQLDLVNFKKMLEKMEELLHGGKGKKPHVEEAYQMAQMEILPGVTNLQGDSMGILASLQGLATSMQQAITNAENDSNSGSITPKQAEDFVKSIQGLYSAVKNSLKLLDSWLGPSTANNILKALDQLSKDLGSTNGTPSGLNPKVVKGRISEWYEHPTTTSNNGQTGTQCLQDLQNSLNQATNSISSQSQGEQAQQQFLANVITQFINITKAMLSATQKEYQNFVQHQIA